MDTVLLAKSALVRAVRTFIQVMLMFLATNVSEITDVATGRAIAGAAIAAGVAAAWRAFIDPLPVPTLMDPAPALGNEEHPMRSTDGPGSIHVGPH